MKNAIFLFFVCAAVSAAAERWNFERPYVVPEPKNMSHRAHECVQFDNSSVVRVVCGDPAAQSWVAARCSEWFGVRPSIACVPDAGRALPADEGYRLVAAEPANFTVEASTLAGVRHAFATLRQALMPCRGSEVTQGWICPGLVVEDAPEFRFRAVHLCWLQETDPRLIERQIRLAALFKFNVVVIEPWGTFVSKTLPWYGWPDGTMTHEAIARLVALARTLGVTLVPQVNAFGHASQARRCSGKHAGLDLKPEYAPLFEPREGWTWCLTNPATQNALRKYIGELHDAFGRPPWFHIGCDEADPPSCPVCRAADWPKTVGGHIRDLAAFLAGRGARTLMWHDMLVSKKDSRFASLGRYPANGASAAACGQMLSLIPKDVVICDWYYGPKREEFPTWRYFAESGRSVVACSWERPDGTLSMGRAALDAGLSGFMATTWHHADNAELYLIYLPAAFAAWGTGDFYNRRPDGKAQLHDFASPWRMVGWDMKMSGNDEAGYCADEIPRHAHTPR